MPRDTAVRPSPAGLRGDVDIVPERRQTVSDRLHVDRPTQGARHMLIESAIEHAHGQGPVDAIEPEPSGSVMTAGILASKAKYGPDRNRPNSQTSSIITADVTRSS